MLADTYVWSDAEDPNLYGEWDFEVRRLVYCSPGMLKLCDYSGSLIPTLDPCESRYGNRRAAATLGSYQMLNSITYCHPQDLKFPCNHTRECLAICSHI
jgi:hypothetical protein